MGGHVELVEYVGHSAIYFVRGADGLMLRVRVPSEPVHDRGDTVGVVALRPARGGVPGRVPAGSPVAREWTAGQTARPVSQSVDEIGAGHRSVVAGVEDGVAGTGVVQPRSGRFGRESRRCPGTERVVRRLPSPTVGAGVE